MNLNLTTASRYGLNILALLAISIAFYLGSSIFIPLTISVLLATILYPAATWMHRYLALPWFFCCLVTILLLIVIHFAIFTALATSIPQLINKLPANEQAWQEKYTETAERLSEISPFPIDGILPRDAEQSNFYKSVKQLFSPESVSHYLQKLAGFGLEQFSQLVLILFITLFMMLEGEILAKKGRAIFGTSNETQDLVTQAIAEMAEAVRTYLVWRTIVNMGLGIVIGLAYRNIFNLEQWYLWAVLTALLSYVPYIGTIAAGIPPVIEALITGRPDNALGILIFYTMVCTIEGYLIVPWVMGRSMDLNATTVMLSCLFWHLIWGIAGLFLAMPLMAAIKAVCMHVEEWNAWGRLMSSGEDLEEKPPTAATAPTVSIKEVLIAKNQTSVANSVGHGDVRVANGEKPAEAPPATTPAN